jgi:hypothetical protein
MEKKNYVGNGKKKEFSNGGSLINISLQYAKLVPNEKGYVNLVVGGKKETDQYGNTHAVWVNDFKPTNKSAADVVTNNTPPPTDDDLPF